MTTEEKAKAYDSALERARAMYDVNYTDSYTKANLETIFPELRESEDEKFRKYILQVCKECIEANDNGLELSMSTTKKLLDYLEKQKEQNKITIEQAYKEFINPEKIKDAKTNKYIRGQLLWELVHNGIITEADYLYLTDVNRKPWAEEGYLNAYKKGFETSEQLKRLGM